MDQADKKYKAFSKVMDVTDNSTGGGSASSIAGAMAAGLAVMVARLSMNKKDLEPAEHYEALAHKCEVLCARLFEGGAKDSEAFAVVSKSFGMPKGTDEEKAARSQAIRDGMTLCAEVPLENATMCTEVLVLCKELEKNYNMNTSSDLECAMHLSKAAIKGCAANVRVNLPYLKDEKQVRDLETRLEAILNESL